MVVIVRFSKATKQPRRTHDDHPRVCLIRSCRAFARHRPVTDAIDSVSSDTVAPDVVVATEPAAPTGAVSAGVEPELTQVMAVSSVSVRVPADWQVGPEEATGIGTGPIEFLAAAIGDDNAFNVEALASMAGGAIDYDDFIAGVRNDPVYTENHAVLADVTIGSIRAFSIPREFCGIRTW